MKTFYEAKSELEKELMRDRDCGNITIDEYKERMENLNVMHELFLEAVYKSEAA